MTTFPGAIFTPATLVDLVDSVLASHQNDPNAEITQMETLLSHWEPVYRWRGSHTMAGNESLVDTDGAIQNFDVNGANRIVSLPASDNANHAFLIFNTGAAPYTLDIQTSGGVSILLSPLTSGAGVMVVPMLGTWKPASRGAPALTGVQILGPGTVTYTPTPGTRFAIVECVGAGGGGGGGVTGATATSGGSGGGSGGYARKLVIITKTSYTVSVPSGGAGAVAGNNNGTAGAACTFDSPSVCTANGGTAGLAGGTAGTTANVIPGGAQSAASGVGDFTSGGGSATPSIRMSATQAVAGGGGGSCFGTGGYGRDTQGAGAAASIYGAGGGGGLSLNGGASVAGGQGGGGVIIVTEFA